MIFKYMSGGLVAGMIVMWFALNSANNEIRQLSADIGKKDAIIAIKESDIEDLTKSIDSRNKEIQKQNLELTDKQKSIKELLNRKPTIKTVTLIKEIKADPLIKECTAGLEYLRNKAGEIGKWQN